MQALREKKDEYGMRLIDADVLIEKLEHFEQSSSTLKGIGLEPLMAIKTVGEMVQAMPTVDAEPIVRCKDCDWLGTEDDGVFLPDWACGWCPNVACSVKPDGFCDSGKRRDYDAPGRR